MECEECKHMSYCRIASCIVCAHRQNLNRTGSRVIDEIVGITANRNNLLSWIHLQWMWVSRPNPHVTRVLFHSQTSPVGFRTWMNMVAEISMESTISLIGIFVCEIEYLDNGCDSTNEPPPVTRVLFHSQTSPVGVMTWINLVAEISIESTISPICNFFC